MAKQKKNSERSNLFKNDESLLGAGIVGIVVLLGTLWFAKPMATPLNTPQQPEVATELQSVDDVSAASAANAATQESFELDYMEEEMPMEADYLIDEQLSE